VSSRRIGPSPHSPRHSIPTPSAPSSSTRTAIPKFPEVSGLDQRDPVDPCRPLPLRDHAMAAEPTSSRGLFDTEMVNPIRASTDRCRVPATRLGCSISSVHRWRPGRFETRSWMNCSAGTPPTELQKAIAAFVGTNKEAGPVRRLSRRECMRSSAVARPQINGPAPIPIQALPPTGSSSWPL
jgi:hypothetical protein